MIEKPFFEQFPKPLPRDPQDVTRQWIEAHADDLATYDEALEQIAISQDILKAEGRALDEIGKDFGVIGRRRGRGDDEYRAHLLSIANAFEGRGTDSGMRYAIGAGIQARPDEVEITEYVDHHAYSVTVHDWISHKTSTIDMLADLADPSGVELYNPGEGEEVAYEYGPLKAGAGFDEAYRDAIISSPDLGAGAGFGEATASAAKPGFGAGRFDGADPFGDAGGFGTVSAQDESVDETDSGAESSDGESE